MLIPRSSSKIPSLYSFMAVSFCSTKKENIYAVVMRTISWVAVGEGGNPQRGEWKESNVETLMGKKIEELPKLTKFQVVEWISN